MLLSIKSTTEENLLQNNLFGREHSVWNQETLIAMLGAFALFLSTIEYMIPKPVPFMRLGLANVPIMMALELLSPGNFVLLVLLKVIGQALVNGTLFSYIVLFSFGGTVSSSLVMFCLYRYVRKYLSFLGISIAGALASNGVQLLLSGYIMFGASVWLIAPPFLIMGFITSIVLGLFVERFVQSSAWFSLQCSRRSGSERGVTKTGRIPAVDSRPHARRRDPRLISGMLVLPALLLQPTLTGTTLLTFASISMALFHGRRFRIVPNMLVLLSVTLANLLQANGLVLVTVWGFSVTAGALAIGVKKALTLIGLIYVSQFMVSGRPSLPGAIGSLISLQLYYFERITEIWKRPGRGGLIAALDRLLFALDDIASLDSDAQKAAEVFSATESASQGSAHSHRGSYLLFVLFSWTVLVLGYLHMIP